MTTYDITHKQLHLAGLILENFKSFGERTVVPMAPITLLFGENSAGKSSILQSLLLLKQTAAASEPGRPLLLARGDLVDLGSVREMLYAHDPERVAEISLLFSGEDSLGRTYTFWPFPHAPLGSGVRFGCRADSPLNELVIHELPVYWGETHCPITKLAEITESQLERWRAKWDLVQFPGQHHFREGQFIDQSGERAYTADFVDADHPAMRGLYDTFTEYWKDLAKILRAWPSTELMKGWEHFREESTAQSADAECLEYSAQGYLGAVIDSFKRQGRDLVTELLDRFDNYTYEQYVSDAATRGSTLCRVRGFQLMLPGDAGGRISMWRMLDPEEEPTPEPLRLPSLEGVVGALFKLTYEIDAFEEAYTYTDGVGTVAIDVPHALLPSPSKMTEEAQMFLDGQLAKIAYVGPLRERPARHYMYSGLSWPSVDKTGANLPEMLLADEQVLADLNEALRTMEAGYEVEAVRAEGPGAEGLFWLRLRDARTGIAVSPTDVGFGVSQVLPVLTQLLVSRNKLLLFEQPEIHLHPRLEAELGCLLARSASARHNNQVIVETHSEYLIYRIQKLIRLGQLRPDDVSVVYVTKDDQGSHCTRLRLDDEGDFLDPWPGGFFDTGFDEMFGVK